MAERGLKQGRDRGRHLRWLTLVLGAGIAAAVFWKAAPSLLSRLEFFRIRRVEIAGLQYLPPAKILAAMDLHSRSSVFDDLSGVGSALTTIPGVRSAQVSRRLPGTLEIAVEEAEPVAFAPRVRGMVLLDSSGQLLPFDPSASAPDLPIAPRPDRVLARVLARVRGYDAALFDQISSAWRVGEDVVLDWEGRRLWLSPEVSVEDIRAVIAVAQDLARQRRDYRELDGRFAGQVIVRRAGA